MLDKDQFFDTYRVKDEFESSGLSWDVLERIYDDYLERGDDLLKCRKSLEAFIKDNMRATTYHSISSRIKDPMHLIEKIIRKTGAEQSNKYEGINETNYCEIIRDLIGVRILVLAKEDWEGVFDWLTGQFPEDDRHTPQRYMAEAPIAYTRYGDRDIFGEKKIKKEHTNKGYRSQHYIVKFGDYYCEIQVRTLAEEVYGEFDHLVKYPYRQNNKFLRRYTSTMSQLLDSVDEMLSTCISLKEGGWEECEKYYEADHYIDWQHTSQASTREELIKTDYESTGGEISFKSYAEAILLRKEKQ